MVNKRNRIIEVTSFLKALNIEVNIGKNKARGNKGFFVVKNSKYRIDISKGLSEENILRTLVHEFAHFVHYSYDKSLKSLDFIFSDSDDIFIEELIKVTVESIPKDSIKPLFDLKTKLNNEISNLAKILEKTYDNFTLNKPFLLIENKIKKTEYKYLLKHDKVKLIKIFQTKIITIDDLKENNDINLYIRLKSKQRALKRINSKLAKLNKYYNSPTELFARSFEQYIFEPEKLRKSSEKLFETYNQIENNREIPLLYEFIKLLKNLY